MSRRCSGSWFSSLTRRFSLVKCRTYFAAGFRELLILRGRVQEGENREILLLLLLLWCCYDVLICLQTTGVNAPLPSQSLHQSESSTVCRLGRLYIFMQCVCLRHTGNNILTAPTQSRLSAPPLCVMPNNTN